MGTIKQKKFTIDGVDIIIEKHIPVCKKKTPGFYAPWAELIKSLEIKESFVYPYHDRKVRGKVYNSLTKIFKDLGYKYSSCSAYDDNGRLVGLRFWRIE